MGTSVLTVWGPHPGTAAPRVHRSPGTTSRRVGGTALSAIREGGTGRPCPEEEDTVPGSHAMARSLNARATSTSRRGSAVQSQAAAAGVRRGARGARAGSRGKPAVPAGEQRVGVRLGSGRHSAALSHPTRGPEQTLSTSRPGGRWTGPRPLAQEPPRQPHANPPGRGHGTELAGETPGRKRRNMRIQGSLGARGRTRRERTGSRSDQN